MLSIGDGDLVGAGGIRPHAGYVVEVERHVCSLYGGMVVPCSRFGLNGSGDDGGR